MSEIIVRDLADGDVVTSGEKVLAVCAFFGRNANKKRNTHRLVCLLNANGVDQRWTEWNASTQISVCR